MKSVKGFAVDATIEHDDQRHAIKTPKLSLWLWQPWYAKLWWSSIPLWWLGVVASFRIEALADFYRGGVASFLSILFFPMTTLMVLGVGYVRQRFDSFVGQGGATPLPDDDEAPFVDRRGWDAHMRFTEGMGRGTDMFDPASGPLWIGNPLNPLNAGYLDPNRR